jgi:glycosyltransferase involved in cell wall biosynthesis
MRILIATSHRNVIGGVEKYLQAVLPFLVHRGHHIALVYENRADAAQELIDSPQFEIMAESLAEAGAERTLRFIGQWKPDVVYSHGLETVDFQSALLNAYPNVLYAHNYIGTCATGQKCHSFPSPQPCDRKLGIGCLVLHYPRRCGGLHPGTMLKMFQLARATNRHLPKYDAVLVASTHMYHEFQRHGVAESKIHLVPLPNPQGRLKSYAPLRTDPRGRLLFIGRLTKLKGVDRLLRGLPLAAKNLGRKLSVTIAGTGPEQTALQALALELGVSAQFVGWMSSSEKPALMRDADLLAVPSLWPEPFGLVGIEAATYGLPAVAYKVGGIPDWLIAGESGELAPGDPPTIEGLADAIVRALLDPGHYAAISRGAVEVASRFTLERHVSRLEHIFDTISRGSRGAIFSAENTHA